MARASPFLPPSGMEMAAGAFLVMISDTKKTSVAPLISFVIPQKGRLDLLERTLRSIATQELGVEGVDGPYVIEVVVVTQDEHPDEACKLVERLLGDVEGIGFQCIVAQDEEATISILRNQAARASRGELLAFIDADIQLAPTWSLATTNELLADNTRTLVSAMQVAGAEPTKIEAIQVQLNHMRVGSNVNALSGHNLLLSRESFESVGGFPEHLQTCEDSVFTDAVAQIGKLHRSSKSSYVHLGEDRTFRQMFNKEKWRSHYNLATQVGRTVQPAELISFFAPAMVLLCWAGFAVFALAGYWGASLFLLLTGALPAVLYTLRYVLGTGTDPGVLQVFRYYLLYFTARGLGMFKGIDKAFQAGKRLRERKA